ncbi:CNNM domain-containing protein, partial [Vibrio lentus]
IATGVLTLVILVFAEVTPKTIASLFPERVSYASSILLMILMKVLSPLVILVNFITNGFIRILGVKARHDATDHLSSEELRTVVNEAGSLIPQRHQD